MKIFLSLSLITCLLLACNTKDSYEKIDPINKIKFKVNDTLIYRSAHSIDSFKIKAIADGYEIYDKTTHIEYYSVGYIKININKIEDSIYNNFNSYNFGHHGNYPTLQWRNIYDWPGIAVYDKKDTTIKIGSFFISNTIVLTAVNNIFNFPFDIIKVYYCHSFGVIQYERYNKEKFMLDTNCFKKYIK